MKPVQMCLKHALFPIASTGCEKKKKKTLLVCELCKKENDPNSHLVYYLDKQSRNEIMAPVAHFKSSSIQREVNEGPMWNKIDNKAGYD